MLKKINRIENVKTIKKSNLIIQKAISLSKIRKTTALSRIRKGTALRKIGKGKTTALSRRMKTSKI